MMESIVNRFLEIFYEISKIPRESGKEDKIADFLQRFANKNGLKCVRDDSNNILIKKDGNKENNEPIILQAHTDMVCVKRKNSNHDFEIDPIEIVRNGDIISAKDTSLGADQGIGLAMMLLILEVNSIKHPDLECLFTTEEETTFNGVTKFDFSKLNGKRVINLDHCKDNSIVIGCDADICNRYIFKGEIINCDMPSYRFVVDNVSGGNSGIEIERCNKSAIVIMAEAIKRLQMEGEILISEISGGKSEGDIATFCECVISTNILDIENKVREILNQDDILISVDKIFSNVLTFSEEDSKRILNEVLSLKQGVIVNKDDIITSGNIGSIRTNDDEVCITGILRSLDINELERQNKENCIISSNNGFMTEEIYKDSVWMPNNKSKLKSEYEQVYYEVNKTLPFVEISHGGLECACIAKRINEIDMISVGSNIENFHTVNEKMYISSCEKTLKTLLRFLECDSN